MDAAEGVCCAAPAATKIAPTTTSAPRTSPRFMRASSSAHYMVNRYVIVEQPRQSLQSRFERDATLTKFCRNDVGKMRFEEALRRYADDRFIHGSLQTLRPHARKGV